MRPWRRREACRSFAACALGFAVEALGVQQPVHGRGARAFPFAGKKFGKFLGILAPAFETRPVAGGERRHLVKEEQFAVAVAPHFAVAIIEGQFAANPLPRDPAAGPQRFVVAMQAPAAIAYELPARGICEYFAERIDAVLQRHLSASC
jgi:hypothetical protein